jgi:hypothetical protein
MQEWINNFRPVNKEHHLALEVARSLDDLENLALYLSYCRRFPESLIRDTLRIVQGIPAHKIRKSRGALFNYLIQKHAIQNNSQNPGN